MTRSAKNLSGPAEVQKARDAAVLQNTFLSLNVVAPILSFPGNVFIVAVNIVDFWRSRRLAVSDRLVCGFGVFCLLHGLHEGYILVKDLCGSAVDEKEAAYVAFWNVCALRFSALLSIHFCLKIVTINHWFYIRLQRRYPKFFPWITLSFLLGFFFLNLYSAPETKPECRLNATTSRAGSLERFMRCSWLPPMFQVICVLCTFLCSVSASTILISLLKHLKRIQQNTERSGSPNIEAHVRAVRTVTALLVTNILVFISMSAPVFGDPSWMCPFGVLMFIGYIFSSYFLIKGTKKLDEKLNEILTWCSGISWRW